MTIRALRASGTSPFASRNEVFWTCLCILRSGKVGRASFVDLRDGSRKPQDGLRV